jgi:hypothetical protein
MSELTLQLFEGKWASYVDEVAAKPKTDVRMLSESVRAEVREGDIGTELGEIARANPEVAIGSYPFFEPGAGAQHESGAGARDVQTLARAKRAVQDMLSGCGGRNRAAPDRFRHRRRHRHQAGIQRGHL